MYWDKDALGTICIIDPYVERDAITPEFSLLSQGIEAGHCSFNPFIYGIVRTRHYQSVFGDNHFVLVLAACRCKVCFDTSSPILPLAEWANTG